MLIVRSLHETADVLGEHASGRMPVERLERLAAQVAEDCATACCLGAASSATIHNTR